MKVTDFFENMPVENETEVLCSKNGKATPANAVLNSEHSVLLFGDGQLLHSFVCSPCELGELCAGWLLSEGFKAESVEISSDGSTAEALCVSSAEFREEKYGCSAKISASYEEMLELFKLASDKYSRSHGIHECVIKGEDRYIIRTDIGRHNAIDKAIGAAYLSGLSLEGAVMFSSGRINVQTVKKAARCKIGMLMSKAVITREALELSEKLGIEVLFSVKNGTFMTAKGIGM